MVGAHLRRRGAEYFNPDEETQIILKATLGLNLDEANGLAWNKSRQLLEESIRVRKDFTFETTLGGNSITKLLTRALDEGFEVVMVFVGLDSPVRHMERVGSRVRAGGHHIPEQKIRERYTSSIRNIVRLAPRLTMLRVYDNSLETDPKSDMKPHPRDILSARAGQVTSHAPLDAFPEWAKPIFAVLTATAAT